MGKALSFGIWGICMLLGMTACGKKDDFTLKGKVGNLSSDTILVFYQIPEYRLDTIVSQKGVFEYSFVPDTLTMFSLIFDAKDQVPVFAEKGQVVAIEGTPDAPVIKGKGENELMNAILRLLRETPHEAVGGVVDSLLRTNVHSFTNLYLIDKFCTHSDSLDFEHLEECINRQSGWLKDTPYLTGVQSKVQSFNSIDKNRAVYSLFAKERDGKDLKWSSIKDKYVLLSFWASWNPQSVMEQDSLASVLKSLRKENFIAVSISLDVNKEAWLNYSDRDTTQWKQVCDFKGWNSNVVKSQGVESLPYHILLDPNKRVVEKNIALKDLVGKMKSLNERNSKKRR